MERLPDRPDALWESEHSETGKNKTEAPVKKQSWKDKLSTYGFLILVIALLFILLQKAEVDPSDVLITDCSANDAKTSFFVAGSLGENQKFAGSQVDFNEETGVAEITLYQYATPTFFGSRDFVAMIDTSNAEVKEIWIKNETDRLQVK